MYRRKLFSFFQTRGARSFSLSRKILEVSDEVKSGLSELKPVVALESTIITHGMPFPENIKCALEVENIVRSRGAIPATIALINGKIKIGLTNSELEFLGDTKSSNPIKTSRRDFPYVLNQRLNGGTTVSGTVIVCKNVGITVFATGGIGGVHRGVCQTFDVSADLTELGRSNVAVVSSGVKSVLDIPKTLEYLETQGVFVATIGTGSDFPAFYCHSSGHHAPYCLESAIDAAKIIKAHKEIGLESGLLFAVPVPEKYALNPDLIDGIIEDALEKADKTGIKGKDVTPFLLSEIATITCGKSLETNIALIKNNAQMAAEISVELSHLERGDQISDVKSGAITTSSENRPVIIGGCNVDCVAHLEADEIKLDGRIHLGRFDYNAGGVGRNICEALGKLGRYSHFISVVGNDQQGHILTQQLPQEALRYIEILPSYSTAQCIVVLDKKGDCSFLMGDMSIHSKITPETIEENEDLIKNSPLIILDGNISEESMEKALYMADKFSIPVFYEPTDITIAKKPFKTMHWRAINFMTPNLNELKNISSYLQIKTEGNFTNQLEEATVIAKSLARFIENVIVTLGPQGIIIARKGLATDPFLKKINSTDISVRHYPVQERNDFVNVSGAGDCFASGFITALLDNLPEERCFSVGLAAAVTALYSQSPVPNKIFNKNHNSWKESAKYTTLL